MDDEQLYLEDDKIKALADRIIIRRRELHWIIESDFLGQIGYVRALEDKKTPGKVIYADCRRITGPVKAFCPYDILITVYPAAEDFRENQLKVLLLHELYHIDIDNNGNLKVKPHNVEDFYSILREFGLDWNYNEDVKDILEEGEKDE